MSRRFLGAIPSDDHSLCADAASPQVCAETLAQAHEGLSAEQSLERLITADFPGGVALVSSFGAESAVLLKMLADVDRDTPVLFLDTEMLFPETLTYQEALAERFGLRDVRRIQPDVVDRARLDPDGGLNGRDTDACCGFRKDKPLKRALFGFEAWITGRKRAQGPTRAQMPRFETDARGLIKHNPLFDWTPERVRAEMRRHDLPAHPLVAKGFPSIGCAPCTTPVAEGEDPRAGRWRGSDKTECGIHVVDGKLVRGPVPTPA